ncbi:MAG: serine/threonine-protein phosphatase [Deltaproteobacteria bacterium]|nr:serine/threonine-protein phosphatase [Deltaproteobacteria bacterium]
MKRDHNEDSYLLSPDLNLFTVADGMGGHAGGEMASGIAVRTVDKHVREHKDLVDPETKHEGSIERSPVAKLFSDAVRAACNAVYSKGQEVPDLANMGTTTTSIGFHQNHGFVAHVGDSRCYLVRDGVVLQLSDDHSLVNEQLKAGLITEAQARQSRFKNIITRSVGFESDVEVDIVAVEIKPNDAFMICSDGLTGLVTDPEINDIMNENFLHRAPEILIDLANSRGGDDNITVVICYIVEEDEVQFADGADEVEHLPSGAGFNSGII